MPLAVDMQKDALACKAGLREGSLPTLSLVLCMHGSMTTAEPSPYSCKSRDKRIPIQLYGTLAGLVLSLLGIISH